MDNELKLINNAFTSYFDKHNILYKQVLYKYRIELFTRHYTIFIKYKISLNNDFCLIKIYNDSTTKSLEFCLNYQDEDTFTNFGENEIRKLLFQLN